jgi:hypothetical protein
MRQVQRRDNQLFVTQAVARCQLLGDIRQLATNLGHAVDTILRSAIVQRGGSEPLRSAKTTELSERQTGRL